MANKGQSNNGKDSSRVPLKTLRIIKDSQYPNMFRVKFNGGGLLPESLSGMYGKRANAQAAIDGWVDGTTRPKIYPRAPKNDIPQRKPPEKVEKNGEEQSNSRV